MNRNVSWPTLRLGDAVDIAIGGTPSRNTPAYWDPEKKTQNRWASISDLQGRFLQETAEHISDLGVKNSNVKPVPPGTVVMSFKLSIGRTAITRTRIFTNEAIASFYPKADVLPEFLLYALPRLAADGPMDMAVKGLTLNKAKLNDLEIRLPSLGEQRKITAILSSMDAAIEGSTTVIDQLRAVKKAMMQELLTLGVPGQHAWFKKTEIGDLPDSWFITPLENALERIIDYRGKSPPKANAGIPLITARNIRDGFVESKPAEFVRQEDFVAWMSRGIPSQGDVLMTTEAPLGMAATAPSFPFALGQRVVVLCPDKKRLDPRFLLWLILSPAFQDCLKERATGSTVKGIKQSVLRTIPIQIPPLAEQRQIASSIDAVALRSYHEFRARRRLVQVKSALLSVLLTGEVRVTPDPEPEPLRT